MIYSNDEIKVLISRLLVNAENELVEYKQAKRNYDFDDLGKYFSALSNEANLRKAECGWLVFGVRNDRAICGTAYRQDGSALGKSIGLQKLKHEISQHTNSGMTFEEIYEVTLEGKRVVAFQIPAATFATPTTWKGVPWSRESESLVQMPQFKLDAIYGQSRPDWSRQISYEAQWDDLDDDAVAFACAQYVKKFSAHQPEVENFSPSDILAKIGLIVRERITNACLVLLGKPESVVFLGGIEPRITWTLYASNDETIAYSHFEPPFILNVDKVLAKIRNERFRYFNEADTLFPTEIERYSTEVIRELLHNAIAHQDYRLSGKINILEYEDRLVFKNEGSFIPGSIDVALESGYKPPYYRNPLLSKAMSKTDMIDQNAIGIRNVFGIQRKRYLPMPTYDLTRPNRVSVTVYGKVLNENYSALLAAEPNLELHSVFLLDMVQKGLPITEDQAKFLRGRGLVEGRYPQLSISSKVAVALGAHDEYVRNKGLDNSICKQLILQLLASKPSSRAEILSAIDHALPATLSEKQKGSRVSYLLQALHKEGKARPEGKTASAIWHKVD